jgi:hypothetical protein
LKNFQLAILLLSPGRRPRGGVFTPDVQPACKKPEFMEILPICCKETTAARYGYTFVMLGKTTEDKNEFCGETLLTLKRAGV